ncbi:MAG: hypothetical protein ACI8QF_004794 [Limisphaerales bacterium]|jgi:hypothetical protein
MTTELQDNTTLRAGADQMSCDLNGEAAILQLSSGSYFGLDEVGARIWQLLQKPTTSGEIVRDLLGEYEVEAETCRADVLNLLVEMIDAGIVERVNESGV